MFLFPAAAFRPGGGELIISGGINSTREATDNRMFRDRNRVTHGSISDHFLPWLLLQLITAAPVIKQTPVAATSPAQFFLSASVWRF